MPTVTKSPPQDPPVEVVLGNTTPFACPKCSGEIPCEIPGEFVRCGQCDAVLRFRGSVAQRRWAALKERFDKQPPYPPMFEGDRPAFPDKLTPMVDTMLKSRQVEHDPVHSPAHYTDGGVETIDFIEAKGLGYHLGNVVKYVSRAGKKGDPVQDLRKAHWYLERAIERAKPHE